MSGESSGTETAPGAGDRRERVEFVQFSLGEGSYAAELGRVEQLVTEPSVTRVPRTGDAISGVSNLGGEITTVIDGRELLGLPEPPEGTSRVLLRLDRGDAQPAGLLVDDVAGIEAYHVDDVEPTAARGDWEPPVDRDWFRAVLADDADGPTGVLDVEAVIRAARDQS